MAQSYGQSNLPLLEPTKNLSLFALQSNLLKIWTSKKVDKFYQTAMLAYLDNLPQNEAKQQIIHQHERMLQNKSQYNKIKEYMTHREQVLEILQEVLEDEQQIQDACQSLDQLRKINLKLSQSIVEIKDSLESKGLDANAICQGYNQIFQKMGQDNQIVINSYLKKYIPFGKGYDPFFLVPYQRIQKKALEEQIPKCVSKLFKMNISYVYRMIKAKNQIVKCLSCPSTNDDQKLALQSKKKPKQRPKKSKQPDVGVSESENDNKRSGNVIKQTPIVRKNTQQLNPPQNIYQGEIEEPPVIVKARAAQNRYKSTQRMQIKLPKIQKSSSNQGKIKNSASRLTIKKKNALQFGHSPVLAKSPDYKTTESDDEIDAYRKKIISRRLKMKKASQNQPKIESEPYSKKKQLIQKKQTNKKLGIVLKQPQKTPKQAKQPSIKSFRQRKIRNVTSQKPQARQKPKKRTSTIQHAYQDQNYQHYQPSLTTQSQQLQESNKPFKYGRIHSNPKYNYNYNSSRDDRKNQGSKPRQLSPINNQYSVPRTDSKQVWRYENNDPFIYGQYNRKPNSSSNPSNFANSNYSQHLPNHYNSPYHNPNACEQCKANNNRDRNADDGHNYNYPNYPKSGNNNNLSNNSSNYADPNGNYKKYNPNNNPSNNNRNYNQNGNNNYNPNNPNSNNSNNNYNNYNNYNPKNSKNDNNSNPNMQYNNQNNYNPNSTNNSNINMDRNNNNNRNGSYNNDNNRPNNNHQPNINYNYPNNNNNPNYNNNNSNNNYPNNNNYNPDNNNNNNINNMNDNNRYDNNRNQNNYNNNNNPNNNHNQNNNNNPNNNNNQNNNNNPNNRSNNNQVNNNSGYNPDGYSNNTNTNSNSNPNSLSNSIKPRQNNQTNNDNRDIQSDRDNGYTNNNQSNYNNRQQQSNNPNSRSNNNNNNTNTNANTNNVNPNNPNTKPNANTGIINKNLQKNNQPNNNQKEQPQTQQPTQKQQQSQQQNTQINHKLDKPTSQQAQKPSQKNPNQQNQIQLLQKQKQQPYQTNPKLSNQQSIKKQEVSPQQQQQEIPSQKQKNQQVSPQKQQNQSGKQNQLETSTSSPKRQIQMKPGQIPIRQLYKFISEQKIGQQYRSQFEIPSWQDNIKNKHSYLTKFYHNSQLAAFGISTPRNDGDYHILYWGVILNQGPSGFLFKKYLQYLQKFTSLNNIYINTGNFENINFVKNGNLYMKKRSFFQKKQLGYQPFLSVQCSNICFKETDPNHSTFFSEEIQQFSPLKSTTSPQIAFVHNKALDRLPALIKIKENVPNITQVNKILEQSQADTYATSEQINIGICRMNVIKDSFKIKKNQFYVRDGFFMTKGIVVHQANKIQNKPAAKQMVYRLQMNKQNTFMYFGKNFADIQQFIISCNLKVEGPQKNFAFKMFTKQLYGRMKNKQFLTEGCYGNWDIDFIWQDQLKGIIIKDMPQPSSIFGPESFFIALYKADLLLYGFQINSNDFVF